MKLSEKLTHRHIAVIALALGMSFPLYAMADTSPTSDTTTKVVTKTTTTVVKHHHHARMAMHKKRSAAENHKDAVNNAKALNAEAAKGGEAAQSNSNQDTAKRVVWKDGVIFHNVEPTGQATNNGFAAPASTSDTLQGGVTTTPVTQ